MWLDRVHKKAQNCCGTKTQYFCFSSCNLGTGQKNVVVGFRDVQNLSKTYLGRP